MHGCEDTHGEHLRRSRAPLAPVRSASACRPPVANRRRVCPPTYGSATRRNSERDPSGVELRLRGSCRSWGSCPSHGSIDRTAATPLPAGAPLAQFRVQSLPNAPKRCGASLPPTQAPLAVFPAPTERIPLAARLSRVSGSDTGSDTVATRCRSQLADSLRSVCRSAATRHSLRLAVLTVVTRGSARRSQRLAPSPSSLSTSSSI